MNDLEPGDAILLNNQPAEVIKTYSVGDLDYLRASQQSTLIWAAFFFNLLDCLPSSPPSPSLSESIIMPEFRLICFTLLS